MTYRLIYDAPHLSEFVYQTGKSKFRDNMQAAVERAGFRLVDEGLSDKVLHVYVRESPPGGAAAHEFLTGLSLGIIPTWGTREGMYEFDLRLCRKDSALAQSRYLIHTKTFNWILVIPVLWINLFTWNDTPQLLGAAVESFLLENGDEKKTQDQFGC